MSLGSVWGDRENISPLKHNAKDWFVGTGSAIASLPVTQEHNFAKCTQTGSSFVADVCYYRNAGQSLWLPFFKKHRHVEETDQDGGSLFEITVANIKTNYEMNYDNLTKTMLVNTGTAGSTYADVLSGAQKYVEMGTTTGVNSYSQAVGGGISSGFDAKSAFYVKQNTSHNTDILMRSGVNMDDLPLAATLRNQYGFELCTGDGVNYQFVTANGAARTKVNSGSAASTGSIPKGYAAIHTPGSSVLFKTSTSSGSIIMTKTTNIPSSGFTNSDDVIRLGVRTTNTTIKAIRVWAVVFAGKITDGNWVDY